MRSLIIRGLPFILAGVIGGSPATAADPDVSIQELRASAFRAADGFQVRAHYDVKIDDPWRFPPLNMTFYATDHGRPILDENGRRVEVTVPLGNPTEYNGDIARFSGDASVTLPGTYTGSVRGLRLNAAVTDPRDGQPLDESQTQMKLGRGRGWRQRHADHEWHWRY